MKNNERKHALYLRVSTERQIQEGYSIGGQYEAILPHLLRPGIVSSEDEILTYIDDGYSGKSMNRPQLQKLIEDIKRGEIGTIWLWDQDRLSRNVADVYWMLDLFMSCGVTLKTITGEINIGTSSGKLCAGVKAVYSQYERDMIIERTNNGLRQKARQGQYPCGGALGLGWSKNKDDIITIDDEKMQIYYLMVELAKEHNSAQEISEYLKINYGIIMNAQKIIRILTDRKYLGEFIYKGELYTNIFPRVITEEDFMLASKTSIRHKEKNSKNYFFTKRVKCLCGNTMVNTSTTRRGKKYHYYFCESCKKGINQEKLLLQSISRIITEVKDNEKKANIHAIRRQIEIIDNKIEKMTHQYVNHEISGRIFMGTVMPLDKKREGYIRKLHSLKVVATDVFYDLPNTQKKIFIQNYVNKIVVDPIVDLVLAIDCKKHS